MDEGSTFEFVAHGEAIRDNASVRVTFTGSYEKFDYNPVECKVVPEQGNTPSDFYNPFTKQPPLIQLKGVTERGESIWIPEFEIKNTHLARGSVSWRGISWFFVKGHLDEFDASGQPISCYVFIPETSILTKGIYTPSYDGTIKLDQPKDEIRWHTSLGEARLFESYEYLRGEFGLNRTLTGIQRFTIHIHVDHRGLVSLGSLLSELRGVLDEDLLLLSFLSRKRIAWFEARAFWMKGVIHEAVARRKQWLGFKSATQSWVDLLFTAQAFKGDLFQQLVEKYKASPFQSTLHRVITYLIASYEEGYFEAHLANTYSALEALVDGLSEKDPATTYLMSPGDFKRLTRNLRKFINDTISDPNIAGGVISKLPELRRRTFTERLITLLNKYNVHTARLWPPGTDIKTALHETIKRRNEFVHQGKMDTSLYYPDYLRLRCLVELWILKLLDCPDAAIRSDELDKYAGLRM